MGLLAGVVAGLINGWLTAYVGLPAFIATLGTFYWARGIGSSIVAGTQLNGFPESFNLIGRNLYELLDVMGVAPTGGLWLAVAKAVSVQTIFVLLVALIAGIMLAHTTFGEKVYAIGGNERAANFAGINTRRVRFTSFLISSICAASAGIIYDAFYRSFIPTAGQLRELDSISSIITRERAEIERLRTENRAMLNSLLGTAAWRRSKRRRIRRRSRQRRRSWS